MSSSLLSFPERFGQYVLQPSSGICRTQEPLCMFTYFCSFPTPVLYPSQLTTVSSSWHTSPCPVRLFYDWRISSNWPSSASFLQHRSLPLPVADSLFFTVFWLTSLSIERRTFLFPEPYVDTQVYTHTHMHIHCQPTPIHPTTQSEAYIIVLQRKILLGSLYCCVLALDSIGEYW